MLTVRSVWNSQFAITARAGHINWHNSTRGGGTRILESEGEYSEHMRVQEPEDPIGQRRLHLEVRSIGAAGICNGKNDTLRCLGARYAVRHPHLFGGISRSINDAGTRLAQKM